jgi:flavorubredoxin
VMVTPFDVMSADTGMIAEELVDAATLVIGTPTMLGGPHPGVASLAYLVNLLKPRVKYISVIGSYGWGGRSVEVLTEMLSALKAESLPAVLARGLPGEVDCKALDDLAALIADKHKTL